MKKSSLMFAIFALSLLTDLSFSGEPRSQVQGHFISSLNATVTELRFYEGGYDAVPYKQRHYKTDFPKSSSRYINWELHLEFPEPNRKIEFEIVAIYSNPDGSEFAQQTKKAYIESNWENSYHYWGRGWKEPGNWPVGTYRVDLLIKGQKVASGSFRITAAKAKSTKPRKRPREKEGEIPDDLGEL